MWPFTRKRNTDVVAPELIAALKSEPPQLAGAKADGPAWLRILLLALSGRWPMALLQIIMLILEKAVATMPTPSRIEGFAAINRLRSLTFDNRDSVVKALEAK